MIITPLSRDGIRMKWIEYDASVLNTTPFRLIVVIRSVHSCLSCMMRTNIVREHDILLGALDIVKAILFD